MDDDFRSGGFRNAWLLDDVEPFVFKRLKLKRKIGFFQMHKIHRESIIMERLTASPRVIDIYGYCSTSIFSEATVGDVWTVMVPGTGRALQLYHLLIYPFVTRDTFTHDSTKANHS